VDGAQQASPLVGQVDVVDRVECDQVGQAADGGRDAPGFALSAWGDVILRSTSGELSAG
jgi:hypothetical protein